MIYYVTTDKYGVTLEGNKITSEGKVKYNGFFYDNNNILTDISISNFDSVLWIITNVKTYDIYTDKISSTKYQYYESCDIIECEKIKNSKDFIINKIINGTFKVDATLRNIFNVLGISEHLNYLKMLLDNKGKIRQWKKCLISSMKFSNWDFENLKYIFENKILKMSDLKGYEIDNNIMIIINKIVDNKIEKDTVKEKKTNKKLRQCTKCHSFISKNGICKKCNTDNGIYID